MAACRCSSVPWPDTAWPEQVSQSTWRPSWRRGRRATAARAGPRVGERDCREVLRGRARPLSAEREFREFLTFGAFEHGVARFRCDGCTREHLVPFSCKGRAWCPSCGGRRMTERAAHLVDAVL